MPSSRMEGQNAGLPLTWYSDCTSDTSNSLREISWVIDIVASLVKTSNNDLFTAFAGIRNVQ